MRVPKQFRGQKYILLIPPNGIGSWLMRQHLYILLSPVSVSAYPATLMASFFFDFNSFSSPRQHSGFCHGNHSRPCTDPGTVSEVKDFKWFQVLLPQALLTHRSFLHKNYQRSPMSLHFSFRLYHLAPAHAFSPVTYTVPKFSSPALGSISIPVR